MHSILDSEEFELDKDFHRVEPTLDCHQKESVQVCDLFFSISTYCLWYDFPLNDSLFRAQGSHVMAHNGNYVLQWICPPTCDTPAQLMFFYEVLSSENYKGSMSNLQSGISAMSLASSCQSR